MPRPPLLTSTSHPHLPGHFQNRQRIMQPKRVESGRVPQGFRRDPMDEGSGASYIRKIW